MPPTEIHVKSDDFIQSYLLKCFRGLINCPPAL